MEERQRAHTPGLQFNRTNGGSRLPTAHVETFPYRRLSARGLTVNHHARTRTIGIPVQYCMYPTVIFSSATATVAAKAPRFLPLASPRLASASAPSAANQTRLGGNLNLPKTLLADFSRASCIRRDDVLFGRPMHALAGIAQLEIPLKHAVEAHQERAS